jgi:uncharacterized protein Yka (UPF0111/DUF47 family)
MLNLKPRKPVYFGLFAQHGAAIALAAKILDATINDMSLLETNIILLKKIESEGDKITRQVFDYLNAALITPFDREDIFKLTQCLDDILDFIYDTVDRMVLYRVTKSTPCIVEMSAILVDVANRVNLAVGLLKRVSANQSAIIKNCREINTLERKGYVIFRQGIQTLFDHAQDPMDFIRWKEIYEHMEHLLDVCEDLGNVLKGIVLKYA